MDTLDERVFRIKRNLTDAGCSKGMIEEFLALEQKHKRKEQHRLLMRHKTDLLQSLHKDQYKIDCLDHLIYVLHEEEKRTEETK